MLDGYRVVAFVDLFVVHSSMLNKNRMMQLVRGGRLVCQRVRVEISSLERECV